MPDKQTILLVEDDHSVRRFLSNVLNESGFETLSASDGKEAIGIYAMHACSINAIMSDLRMPNVGGAELAKYNFDHMNLPFVVCTVVSDALLAIDLLKIGVRDYLEKPVDPKRIIFIMKNAIRRAAYLSKRGGRCDYDGNVGSITIPSKSEELLYAHSWIENHLSETLGGEERDKLLNYTFEFLLNAHEHGNLGVGEKEKAELIEANTLEEEIERRETDRQAHIGIALSVLENEIAISITDEGKGFDYDKYFDMTNGRGIQMGKLYFDSIEYANQGTQVLLRKTI